MFSSVRQLLVSSLLVLSATGLAACGGGGSGGDNTPPPVAKFALAVADGGGGSVTSSPAGISCTTAGGDCVESYNSGTSVTLTAMPDAGFVFSGWGSPCTGTGPCTVTVTADTTVTATFSSSNIAVTVTKSGTGTGVVTSSPAGINCGTACSANFARGTTLTLTATPDSNQTFDGWGGAAAGCGTTPTCTRTLNSSASALNVVASFSATPRTNVSVALGGNGMGTVTSTDGGINCPGTCSMSYNQGGMIVLNAAPANANNVFTSWTGDASGCGTSTRCTLMLSAANLNAVANFQPVNRTLTVSLSGGGVVTSNPAGINCGTSCTATYQNGSTVQLTATANSGQQFQGFSGGGCSTSPCTVTLTADTTVTATFVSTNVTLSVTTQGSGMVVSTPAGISCTDNSTGTCTASFARGSSVTLKATANGTNVFQGYSGGGCTGTADCTLTLNADNTAVTASFASASGQTVGELYGLTSASRIVSFDRATPGTFRTAALITGIQSGEKVLAIDTRPADEKVYALTDGGRLYTVDVISGQATLKSTLKADSTDPSSPFTGLSGSTFGIDFNPVADRLRIVSDNGQNLRVNADSGAVTTDTALNQSGGTTPKAADGAYTFNYATPTSTSLFVVDSGSDQLYLQNPPNNGTQTLIGSLGVDLVSSAGFEIMGTNIDAFVAGVVAGGSAQGALFSIDLRKGTATKLGDFAGNEAMIGLTGRIVTAQSATPGDLALLTTSGKLITVNRAAADTALTNVYVTGVPAAETLIDIDYRPADRALYALTRDGGNKGRLYTVDVATGSATLVSTVSATLSGTNATMDFEPTTDTLRILTDANQNLSVVVATGAATASPALNPGTPAIATAGYSNSFLRAQMTSLYAIDYNTHVLNRLNPATGTLTAIGDTGITNIPAAAGFDIDARNNQGLLSITENGAGALYSVNLDTGAATRAATLPGAEPVIGTASKVPAEPDIYGVVDSAAPQTFVRFQTNTSATYTSLGTITLPGSAKLLGLAFRPRTGDLVALGSDAKLYTINTTNGTATLLSTLTADSADTTTPFTTAMVAAANSYALSFNPVVDRLRVVSSTNVNLRINVDSGAVTTDTNTARSPFAITGTAYTATNPVLYGLDSASNRLFTINPSNGLLTQVGTLGLAVSDVNGFDIIGNGAYFAARDAVDGVAKFYSLALSTGKASPGVVIGSNNGAITSGTDVVALSARTQGTNDVYAVTVNGSTVKLISFDRADATTLFLNRALTGIGTGETIIGMDFAAITSAMTTTDTLYLLTKDGSGNAKLYTVDFATATATAVTRAVTCTAAAASLPLGAASGYGVEYTPGSATMAPQQSNGTLRITSSLGLNAGLETSCLTPTVGTPLNQTVPVLRSAAYTRNYPGALLTQLLAGDSANASLMSVGKATPNDGQLFDIAPFGVAINATTGAALGVVGGDNGYAFGIFNSGTTAFSTLYPLNLATTSAGPALGTPYGVVGNTATNTTTPRLQLIGAAARLP